MIKRRLFTYCALLAGGLFSAAGAGAQPLSWHVTHSDHIGSIFYHFTAISSFGDNCTVGATLFDTTIKGAHNNVVLFMRSNDGGRTWKEQDPGLGAGRDHGQYQIRQIQQIDSLNVVASGDSGLIVRTFDGGATWLRQNPNSEMYVDCMHFSDSATGIIALAGLDSGIIETTYDGGRTWLKAAFQPWWFMSNCRSFGSGRFNVFSNSQGTVYSTTDGWLTWDSTTALCGVMDSVYLSSGGTYEGTDTIVAYGQKWLGASNASDRLFLTRSLDGGKHWTELHLADSSSLVRPGCMSALEGRYVLLGGLNRFNPNYIGRSDDHGASWHIDAMRLDTNYAVEAVRDVTVSTKGYALAIASQEFYASFVNMGAIILRGELSEARVDGYERIVYATHVYPNPASSQISITSVDHAREIRLYDVLGREVARDMLSSQGSVTLNTSSLASGIYTVMLDHYGKILPVGKVAVIAR